MIRNSKFNISKCFFGKQYKETSHHSCRFCKFSVDLDTRRVGSQRLVQHAMGKVHEKIFEKEMKDFVPKGSTMDSHVQRKPKGGDTYVKSIEAWMNLVIHEHHCFEIVESETLKAMAKIANMDTICTKTLVKYIEETHKKAFKNVSDFLPEKFGIVFDGWKRFSKLFVASFAFFVKNGKEERILLGIRRLPDHTNQTALNHKDYLEQLLAEHGKTLDNVSFLVGDNCKTNIFWRSFGRNR
jgi:hypothetical protein